MSDGPIIKAKGPLLARFSAKTAAKRDFIAINSRPLVNLPGPLPIQELLKQNQQLREQLQEGHSRPGPSPTASNSNAPTDQLKDWKNHLIPYGGPSVTGMPQ